MDSSQTAAFSLGEGSEAVLLVHGFTGSPWEMRPLGDALAERGFFVHCPRLPGHGTTPEAMLGAGHEDWLLAATDAFQGLTSHRRVFVAGLSMGALLALSIAARHPGKVSGLALLAPALRFRGLDLKLAHALRHTPALELARPWLTKGSVDVEDAKAKAEAPVLHAFPSTRLQDLFRLQDLAREALPRVLAPTLIAVARHDHVVDPRASEEIARGLTRAHPVRQVVLERGFHQIPRDRDGAHAAREVGDFFTRFI